MSPVNDVIGLIAGEGEDAKSRRKQAFTCQRKNFGPRRLPRQPPSRPLHLLLNGQRGPRIFASPLARRIAKESGLDLAAIAGTGPHGRIIERDVKAVLAKAPAAPAVQELRAPAAPSPPIRSLG